MNNESFLSDEDVCIAVVMVSNKPGHFSKMVAVRIEIIL